MSTGGPAFKWPAQKNWWLRVATLVADYLCICVGLLYSAAALGPACGFIAGSAFLQIYIDIPLTPPAASSASPSAKASIDIYSQSWLGAWWMGMLVFGGLACLTSLPVIAFPRRLPKESEAKYREEKFTASSSSSTPPHPSTETTLVGFH